MKLFNKSEAKKQVLTAFWQSQKSKMAAMKIQDGTLVTYVTSQLRYDSSNRFISRRLIKRQKSPVWIGLRWTNLESSYRWHDMSDLGFFLARDTVRHWALHFQEVGRKVPLTRQDLDYSGIQSDIEYFISENYCRCIQHNKQERYSRSDIYNQQNCFVSNDFDTGFLPPWKRTAW